MAAKGDFLFHFTLATLEDRLRVDWALSRVFEGIEFEILHFLLDSFRVSPAAAADSRLDRDKEWVRKEGGSKGPVVQVTGLVISFVWIA